MKNNNPLPDEVLIFDQGVIEEKEYWLEKLADEISPANIKPDYPRPAAYTGKTGAVESNLKGDIYRDLAKLTADDPFLIYAVLMAALNICLYKYTALPSIVIGSPALRPAQGPPPPDNALVIINHVDDRQPFRQFLLNVRARLLEVYDKQRYPFERLLEDLEITAVDNRCPLFDIALVFEDIHTGIPETMNDMTITFAGGAGEISGQVIFNESLFAPETIERFTRHFRNTLRAVLENTNALLSEIQILTEEERRQLLVEWNDTQVDYPRDKCNHQLFEECAARTPDAAVLVFADQRLTYRELDHKANQMAHYLQSLGIGPDVLVGICMGRSLEMVVALLGILKAGGAYVPLDPTYPKERLAAMLEDAPMLQVLLTTESLLDRLPGHKIKVICLDRGRDWQTIIRQSTEPPVSRATVHNLVYVIFTSGSTGRPKGAAVYHRGWTNLMHWFDTEFAITPRDKVLVISSFSFDITQRSLAMPLIVGAELHLLASDFYEPELIMRTIFTRKITLLNCSPSTFYPLIETKDEHIFAKLHSLRCLFLGGEAISASRLRHWAESGRCNTEVANVYGAAECSDVSSFYRLKDYQRYIESSVPAGKPIYNSQVYILDKHLNPVPVGAAGEICLAGDGVGKGYINDEALSAEKFVANPFSDTPGSGLYKTGDLGRFLPDGNIEYIGRVDYQVKVRGLRIELGDIETVLRQHTAIKEAVVVKREFSTGDQRLVAYVVPGDRVERETGQDEEDQEQLIDRLKLFLKEKLPPYMVPNVFVRLKELPLSPNGKVDRKALPDPETSESGVKIGMEVPRTPTEVDVAAIIAETLKMERIGIFDNFFEVGGHSLLATQVIARVNEVFQVELNQVDFLVNPTVAGLAKRIEDKR
jgi:amino acid adenylation domain-containing protein